MTESSVGNVTDRLAERYEAYREHLTGVAYRMLGSLGEAEDAVQEAWLRVSRSDTSGVQNLGGWLTTVVARVCLDALRTRAARREEPITPNASVTGSDPDEEATLADSVGLALLVVLDTLAPAERVAFVLHDVFDLPFDEIASIVDRTPAAARQLASRARRRLRGPAAAPDRDLERQRMVAEAFLAASRGGDIEALVQVLDPDVVLRVNGTGEARGVRAVTGRALAHPENQRYTQSALINGAAGLVVAPRGRLSLVLLFTVVDHRITEIDVLTDPARLHEVEIYPWLGAQ
jgi:RNA polymerase sigma-70 factor (ECF subfamily)